MQTFPPRDIHEVVYRTPSKAAGSPPAKGSPVKHASRSPENDALTRTPSLASLLVAALVMLRQPCARNQATAQLLLERAAEHTALTPAEREACLEVADTLDRARPAPRPLRPGPPHRPACSVARLRDTSSSAA